MHLTTVNNPGTGVKKTTDNIKQSSKDVERT